MANLLNLSFKVGKNVVEGSDLNKMVQAINEVAEESGTFTVDTPITTVGNGTLTAAGIVGGQITRTGPTANYTDTTATAAQIVTALGNFVLGSTFAIIVKNGTAFVQTINAGTGVTLPLTNIVSPYSISTYFGTVGGTAASPTIVFSHQGTYTVADAITATASASTALTTVGAGTITAAGINGGFTARSGSTSAFTDTTDIAANIIAGQPGIVNKIGSSFLYTYVNNTVAVATLTGGTGVTVSGITVVPANSWARYLVTYTAAATITMVGVEQGYFPSSGTFISNSTSAVTVPNAAVTAGSNITITLKTPSTPGASPPAVATITPGTGFTVKGLASDLSTYNYEIRG
jgi:hypothetical protein